LSNYNRLSGHFRRVNLEAAQHLVRIATDDSQLYGSYIGCRTSPYNNVMHPVCLKALLPHFDCVCPWVKIVDAESPVAMCAITQYRRRGIFRIDTDDRATDRCPGSVHHLSADLALIRLSRKNRRRGAR